MSTINLKGRPNKQAKGFTKHYYQMKEKGRRFIENPVHPNFNHILNTLIVRGTLDHLAKGKTFYFKKIKIQHPTDMGFYKEAYVLTDSGKRRLQTMKRLKAKGLPLWEYMYKNEKEI